MQVGNVLAVRDTPKSGFRVGHVQVGDVFGDVVVPQGVEAGDRVQIVTELQSRQGRLVPVLRLRKV